MPTQNNSNTNDTMGKPSNTTTNEDSSKGDIKNTTVPSANQPSSANTQPSSENTQPSSESADSPYVVLWQPKPT